MQEMCDRIYFKTFQDIESILLTFYHLIPVFLQPFYNLVEGSFENYRKGENAGN